MFSIKPAGVSYGSYSKTFQTTLRQAALDFCQVNILVTPQLEYLFTSYSYRYLKENKNNKTKQKQQQQQK